MVKEMAENPIIFALANPDPEILPEHAHEVRPDVIMATGRSDYPNQVNNALCFPVYFPWCIRRWRNNYQRRYENCLRTRNCTYGTH